MMFLLLGRMTTWSAGAASTASSSWAVDGFIVWPPVTMPCTPSEWKMRRMPSPVATATTAVSTGSAMLGAVVGRLGLAHPALLLDLLEQVGDPDVAGTPGRVAKASRAWRLLREMPSRIFCWVI